MLSYVLRRVVYMALTLVGVTTGVFILIRLVPGDVVSQMVDLQSQSDPGRTAELRRFFGLDRPWYEQYLSWISNVVVGDLGDSWRLGGSVMSHLLPSIAVTLELTLLATLFSILVGIPLGVWSAIRQNRPTDAVLRIISLAGLSVPVFWTGSMLILLSSTQLRWTPPAGWTSPIDDPAANAQQMLLPVVTLGAASAAVIVRMMRNALLDVFRQDYVRTARSKGLREQAVLLRHALKNALIPVVTVSSVQMGILMGGAVVVEEVFALPGVGRLLLQALTQRDYPLVQGGVLVIAFLFMVINLVTDLLYAVLDPRIHYA